MKPENPVPLVIICDGPTHNPDGTTNLDSIIKINGYDVSNFTTDEKEKKLLKSHVRLFLPKKDYIRE